LDRVVLIGSVLTAHVTSPTLLSVVPSFTRHLRAENKSKATIAVYTDGVRRFHDFCSANGMPLEVASITAEHVESFIADQLERLRPASARTRYAALGQFFAWLASRDEREIQESPMRNLRPPSVPEVAVPVVEIEHLKALIRSVEGDTSFRGRRDTALIRLFIDTGCRLSELALVGVHDVDLDAATIAFVGKGGHERVNPIGTKSIRATDRYLRVRSGHRDAESSKRLWLGHSGEMTPAGIADAVQVRARAAGIGHIHVHQLRHSAAHYLRLNGADDDALLRLMGWKDRSMLHRYGASAADARAREVHSRLGIGDQV
jgi:site-specific recombinase XerD